MSMTASQLHEAIELGDDFLVGMTDADEQAYRAARALGDGELVGIKSYRKKPQAYKADVTRLERQLQHCAEAYDELHADFADATGRHAQRYDDPRVITVGRSPVFIRYPNGGYRAVSKTEAAKYNLLSLAAKKLYQARHDPTCANISGPPPGGYRMVQTPAGISLRMASRLVDQWKALSPAQQRSLLWRATRNRTTTRQRSLPCL